MSNWFKYVQIFTLMCYIFTPHCFSLQIILQSMPCRNGGDLGSKSEDAPDKPAPTSREKAAAPAKGTGWKGMGLVSIFRLSWLF